MKQLSFINGTKPYMLNGSPSEYFVLLSSGNIAYKCNALEMPSTTFDVLSYWGITKQEEREKVSPTAYATLMVLAAKEKDYENGKRIEAALNAPSPQAKDLTLPQELIKAHDGLLEY